METRRSKKISRGSLWLALLASMLICRLDLASSWHFFDQTEPRPFGALHSSALSLPINAPANQPPDVAVTQSSSASTGAQLVADLVQNAVQKSLDVVVAASNQSETNAPIANPSLAGKILNVLTSEPAKNVTSQVLQTLKPRHKARDPAQYIEQQIINQHATSLSSQRLLPTKQRDQKLTSSLLSSGSDSRDSSPFFSIFDSFKSGVTSRSSIVKAISDNKLARTLSEMGKSLSGNKLVAGAALASTVAALGLTVSKLLSPYLFAGGSYSKLGLDPLMGSDSMLRQSLTNYPTNTDRNYLYTNGASPDSMLAAATQNNPLRAPQLNGFSNPQDFTLEPTFDSSQQQGYYPTTVQYQPSKSADPQLYLSYTTRPAYQTGSGKAVGDTNGHYSDFYASNSADQSANNLDNANYLSQAAFQRPRYSQSSEQFQESSPNYELVSSGSLDSPIFIQSKRNFDSNGRRSGPVSLKMDQATKMRLYEHLQKQYQQQYQQPQLLEPPAISVDQSNSATFVPISNGLYSARAEKSSRVEQSGAEKRQSPKPSSVSIVKTQKIDDNRLKANQAQEANNVESVSWKPSSDQQTQVRSQQVGGWQSVGKANLSKQMTDSQSTSEELASKELKNNGDKNVNGAEQELLHRVSRTPTSKTSVRVRSHIGSPSMDHESLPTFDSSTGKVSDEGATSTSDKQAVTQQRSSIVLIPQQQQQQVSDSKTNLIQLNVDRDGDESANNNNNNNNVKLIEANTKSGDKLTSGYESGLVAILPTGRATPIKHHNHNEEQQQDAATSGQSATGDSTDKQQQTETESGGKSPLLGQDEFGDMMMTAYGER